MKININLAHEYGYPGLINIDSNVLEEYFTLSDEELSLIATIKQKDNKLGFAVLLKTFDFLGYFIHNFAQVPADIVSFLSHQLNLGKEALAEYSSAKSVKDHHSKLIREFYGIKIFDTNSKQKILEWLIDQYKITSDYSDILVSCIHNIREKQLELPSFSYIEKLVSTAIEHVNKDIYAYFESALSPAQKKSLNNLVGELADNKTKSGLSLLKLIPGKATIVTLHEQTRLLNNLREFDINKSSMGNLSVHKIAWFAKQGKEYNIKDLRRFPAAKRHTILACFIYKNMVDTIDNIVLIFIKKVRMMHAKAEKTFQNGLISYSKSSKAKMIVLHDLTQTFIENWDEAGPVFKRKIVTYKPKEEFEQINIEVKEYMYERSDTYCYVIKDLTSLRKFAKKVFHSLSLYQDTPSSQTLNFVEILKKKWKNKNLHMRVTEEFINLIDKEWRKYIFPDGKNLNWGYFEAFVISDLAEALRSGEVCVEGSNEYSSLFKHVFSAEEWNAIKKEYLDEIGMPHETELFIRKFDKSLDKACRRFSKGIKGNREVSIKNGKLHIARLDKEKVPPYIPSLKQKISKLIGNTNLTDIITDVQLEINFCKYFKHISGGVLNLSQSSVEKLLAALHSSACNLGPSQSAKSTKFSETQLKNARKFYLSSNNLRDANRAIVNAYNKLEIPNIWGDGTSASADGKLVRMMHKNLVAAWNVKYHSTGGMRYNHISDKYIALYSQLINCGVYETEFLLDAIFNEENEIDIKPTKLHADTHGQTKMMFGFCSLLGIKLMPRIKNLKRYHLYKPRANSKYGAINTIFKRAIDWSKIYAVLDDMLRICASIRYGKVRSSLILKKLTTYRKGHKIYEGFRELGLAARTIYIFEYAGSKDIRRMVQLGCNKSEMWHNFGKFVSFGQNGELRTNDFEEQKDATVALELVCNIVAYWNAKRIQNAVQHLRKNGQKIKSSDIKYITPLMTRHINRFGRFEFDLEKRKNITTADEK